MGDDNNDPIPRVEAAIGMWSLENRMVQAIAALEALRPGDRLPGGLVVVPEEPTEEMIEAWFKERWSSFMTLRKTWNAILSAATTK